MSSASKNRKPAPKLYWMNGVNEGRYYEFTTDVTLIGRSSACDVVLGRKSVSRKHARISRDGEDYVLEDLDSDSGTKVDGVRVAGRVRLRDGCEIEICKSLFKFIYPTFRIEDDYDDGSRILGVLDLGGSSTQWGSGSKPEDRLRNVLEISRSLGDTLHLDAVLEKTLDALFEIFPKADRGFVVLKEGGVMDEVPRAVKFRGEQTGEMTISRTIFNHVMDKNQAVLSADLPNDDRFNNSRSIVESQVRTMMCVPLPDQDRRPAGILQIDTRSDHVRFSQDDLDLLAAVAVLVGVAIDNARLHVALVRRSQNEQETADARDVQRALLPSRTPELAGYEFWHYYEPARSVGGDYFDYLPHPNPHGEGPSRRLVVAVGDVAGKGMPAALLMTRLSAEVRLLAPSGLEPGAVVARLNDNFIHAGIENRFITFLFVLVDGEAHQISVVSAGHMGALIHRAAGTIEILGEDGGGPPLGIQEGLEYRAETASLGKGDRVVLYTDGVSEAINDAVECFGFDRLCQTVKETPGTASRLGESILGAVRRHASGHPQSDDVTLLCFGRE